MILVSAGITGSAKRQKNIHSGGMALLKRYINPAYTAHNRVQLVHGGAEYFQRLEALIRGASHTIHFQTYIFEEDRTGGLVADALMEASLRGVDVYMLLDGYASRALTDRFIQRLRHAGIRFRFFEPVLKSDSFYFGRRLHHKVIVADGCCALVGGVNVSDRYNDLPGDPAWLDWAIQVEGEAAAELHRICARLWVKFPVETQKILARGRLFVPDRSLNCLVRIRQNDWVTRRNEITRSYIQMFADARRDVIIMSSYFLPGRLFRRNMSRAARRGVRIRLILAGTSDVKIAKQAERYMYRWLFRHHVEIYEYRHNVLHGKIAVYDGKWVTGGSYNVNNISAYASIELNLDVLDPAFAGQVEKALEDIIVSQCIRITEQDHNTSYGLFSRFIQRLSYETVRLIFFLFTFYFRQR
jgi:cardiolipin synthase